tara:strand:- start:425 stop:1105 length:681 start_codon:yes stop_codon:yes gene_type:complete
MDKIINYLYDNCEEYLHNQPIHPNVKLWTIADLFIRQYLNNYVDGFGMRNVEKVYYYLLEHKADLIKYNLISKNGWNNSKYPLWKDYNIETKLDYNTIKKIAEEMTELNVALHEVKKKKEEEKGALLNESELNVALQEIKKQKKNTDMLKFFEEYKRLGGKYKTLQKYSSLQKIFIRHTFDLFVMGECSQYNSRDEAIRGVCKEAKISKNEAIIIFHSLDNIHSYT